MKEKIRSPAIVSLSLFSHLTQVIYKCTFIYVIFKPNGSLTFWAARPMSETASILFTAVSVTLSPVWHRRSSELLSA